MTRRMIDSAMWQNEKYATLPPMARLLQVGMINHADDQGRGKAHPSLLRAQVFPYDDVALVDISEWLRLIEQNGTIMLYSVEGKDYYQMCNWWEYQSHQYAMPSDYPKPCGWNDRIRKTFTKGQIVTCNWILSNGTRSPDTCDEQGRIIQVNNQVNIQDKDKDKDKDHDQDKDYDHNGAAVAVPAAHDAAPAATPAASLANQFHTHLTELKESKNKTAKLMDIYKLCFGEDELPDYGRLGKTATQVGGAGRLAELFWQYSAKPPTGDVLSYIVKAHKQPDASGTGAYANGRGASKVAQSLASVDVVEAMLAAQGGRA